MHGSSRELHALTCRRGGKSAIVNYIAIECSTFQLMPEPGHACHKRSRLKWRALDVMIMLRHCHKRKFYRGVNYFRGVQIFLKYSDRGSKYHGGPNIPLQSTAPSSASFKPSLAFLLLCSTEKADEVLISCKQLCYDVTIKLYQHHMIKRVTHQCHHRFINRCHIHVPAAITVLNVFCI